MAAAAIRGKVNTLGRKTFIFILFLRVDILAQHKYICIITIFFCASLDNKIFVGGGGGAILDNNFFLLKLIFIGGCPFDLKSSKLKF